MMPEKDWFSQFEDKPDTGFAPAARDVIPARGQSQPGTQWTQPNYAARAVNTLPALGSMGGMALGGLGGPIGAGLGAGVGSVAGQWARYGLAPMVGLDAPMPSLQSPWETAMDVGAGMLGMGSAATAPRVSRGLMHHALRPTPQELRRMPNLVEAALARGERVGARGAAQRAEAGMAAAKQEIPIRRAALLEGVAQRAEAQRMPAMQASKAAIRSAGNRHTIRDVAEDWIETSKRGAKAAGETWTAQRELKAVAEARSAVRELLGSNRMPTLLDDEALDLVRQRAREKVKAALAAGEKGKVALGPNILKDIESRSRTLLHKSIPGLQKSRATEARSMAVREAALGGNRAQLARLSARGDATAAAGLVPPAAGPAELEAILSGRLLSAAQNRLPWYEQYGAPLAAGGAAYAADRDPASAVTAALMMRMALSPRVQSQTALALENPQVQQLLRYGPLGMDALVRAATARGVAPPDTLGNPPWGTDDPNNP